MITSASIAEIGSILIIRAFVISAGIEWLKREKNHAAIKTEGFWCLMTMTN